jgi:nitrite reductase/ring-hydroxylating ferredoxin subunit
MASATTTREPHCRTCHCAGAPARDGRERRDLLRTLLATSAALLLWPARALAKKLAIRLDAAPQLKAVGGWVVLRVKDREILFARDSASSVRALSPICTHKKTPLKYNAGARRIDCPGHGSQFDLDGRVLKGPAERALPTYPARLDAAAGRIIVDL